MAKDSKVVYLPLAEGAEQNFLKVEVYYLLGGMSIATYKPVARGYYLSVTPVTKKGCMESFIAFTGYKALLLPVNRRSDKKFAEAVHIAETDPIRERLIQAVLSENGLRLRGVEK